MNEYTTHDFKSGDILLASQLNEMDAQIKYLTELISALQALIDNPTNSENPEI